MLRGPIPVSITPIRLLIPGGTLGVGLNDHMDIVAGVRALTGALGFIALSVAQPPGSGITSIIRATYGTDDVDGVIYATVYFDGLVLRSDASYVYDNSTGSGASNNTAALIPSLPWELTISTNGGTGILQMLKYISYKT